ncbi:hypothetical protein MFIFM68171_05773 [Madurella fahalii]|uniref:MYND-type domain-containing protein n=1 Tax=Madurella fahalii TaxID=1157608 RepID=A0ABQ0GCU0_9PEZI
MDSPLPSGSGDSPSAPQDLDVAISVLALVTRRPPNLDRLPTEEILPSHGGLEPDDKLDIVEDAGRDMDIQVDPDLRTLRNKLLDRLAEILARYKTDPKDKGKAGLDARHVASTMMIVNEASRRVKIFCSKNEGLDQEDDNGDVEFLARWRICMEGIAKKGYATTDDTNSMFDLVFRHQRPRVSYYSRRLRDALRAEKRDGLPPKCDRSNRSELVLSEDSVKKLPPVGIRKWVDDRGNKLKIRPSGVEAVESAASGVAVTADSLRNVVSEVDTVFHILNSLCSASELKESQGSSLLKGLISATWTLWKSVRHRSHIKTRLRQQLEGLQDGNKRYNKVISALEFLCRIRQSVFTFIQAAATAVFWQSIECVPVPVPVPKSPRHPEPDPTRRFCLSRIITDRLGLKLNDKGRTEYLRRGSTRANFRKIWKEKRHIHAEIQILHAYATSMIEHGIGGGWVPHTYIGCIRRCYMLCYFFILSYGGLQVRGIHETVMHRWAVPAIPSSQYAGINASRFQAATERLLVIIKSILQELLAQPYPLVDSPQLLAQSSAALSTARNLLDREISKMEKSQLNTRRIMTMPMTFGDKGVVIVEDPGRPGFAYTAGGPLGKGREMTLAEAELWKDNSIRSQLDLKNLGQPPRPTLATPKSCRRCGQPSQLRCSACRTRYCSASCQRRHWPRHVFVCAVPARPNDADDLKMAWFFANDRLCRLFGFTKCLNLNDVANLLCVYDHMLKLLGVPLLAKLAPSIGSFLLNLSLGILQGEESADLRVNCPCMTWLLSFFHNLVENGWMEIPD